MICWWTDIVLPPWTPSHWSNVLSTFTYFCDLSTNWHCPDTSTVYYILLYSHSSRLQWGGDVTRSKMSQHLTELPMKPFNISFTRYDLPIQKKWIDGEYILYFISLQKMDWKLYQLQNAFQNPILLYDFWQASRIRHRASRIYMVCLKTGTKISLIFKC